MRTFLTLLDELKPEVIVTYGGPEMMFTKILKAKSEASVWRFRGQELEATGFAFSARHRWAHAHVDRILTPSVRLADELERADAGAPVMPVVLGLDTKKFARPAGLTTRPEIVILGRFDPVKGHAAAFRMFKLMLAEWPHDLPRPLLHVVGEPANISVAHLNVSVAEAGLKLVDEVRITAARVTDVQTLLGSVALGLVPSLGSELICRVSEEFLLCGTPIGVSGVGSLGETLFDNAGFNYLGRTEVEAARLLGSWTQTSLREGEAAKLERAKAARELYSLEAMGEALSCLL